MPEKKYINYSSALNKAMYLCSKSEKCISDIRKKLYDWRAKPEDHEKIIKELTDQKYIDEQRYADYYVRDKFKFNQWGRIKIRAMLFQKRIPEAIVNRAIDQIDEEAYLKMLKNVIAKKQKTLKEKDANKQRNKLIQFASSRGFEPDLIFKHLII
jgi:regulatory protein